jgi:prevent-host-death family protein
MDTVHVGEFKARFSEFLKRVSKGERIVISYGRKGERVAVLVPYAPATSRDEKRPIGLLRDQASFSMVDDFEMTDSEILSS